MPSYMSSTAVSATGEYLAFGDAEGVIHLLGTAAGPFNGFEGHPVEWADPLDPLPDVEWTDST